MQVKFVKKLVPIVCKIIIFRPFIIKISYYFCREIELNNGLKASLISWPKPLEEYVMIENGSSDY